MGVRVRAHTSPHTVRAPPTLSDMSHMVARFMTRATKEDELSPRPTSRTFTPKLLRSQTPREITYMPTPCQEQSDTRCQCGTVPTCAYLCAT